MFRNCFILLIKELFKYKFILFLFNDVLLIFELYILKIFLIVQIVVNLWHINFFSFVDQASFVSYLQQTIKSLSWIVSFFVLSMSFECCRPVHKQNVTNVEGNWE